MKNLLIGLMILISTFTKAQVDNNLRVTASTLIYETNKPRLMAYYQPSPSINLHLGLTTKPINHKDFDRRGSFTVIFISGLAFTAAAILEGGYQYGTNKPNPQPGNPYNTSYVVPNFWQQTPRQIMLCAGVGFTLVGGIGMLQNK